MRSVGIGSALLLTMFFQVAIPSGNGQEPKKYKFDIAKGARAGTSLGNGAPGDLVAIGHGDPEIPPHLDCTFLLRGDQGGTAIYISEKDKYTIVQKDLEYVETRIVPKEGGGFRDCYVYKEKDGDREWYFPATPTGPEDKFLAVYYSDSKSKGITPYSFCLVMPKTKP
jgi:hypothetical protein